LFGKRYVQFHEIEKSTIFRTTRAMGLNSVHRKSQVRRKQRQIYLRLNRWWQRREPSLLNTPSPPVPPARAATRASPRAQFASVSQPTTPVAGTAPSGTTSPASPPRRTRWVLLRCSAGSTPLRFGLCEASFRSYVLLFRVFLWVLNSRFCVGLQDEDRVELQELEKVTHSPLIEIPILLGGISATVLP
jgi:hypothetical protein